MVDEVVRLQAMLRMKYPASAVAAGVAFVPGTCGAVRSLAQCEGGRSAVRIQSHPCGSPARKKAGELLAEVKLSGDPAGEAGQARRALSDGVEPRDLCLTPPTSATLEPARIRTGRLAHSRAVSLAA